MSEKEFKVGDWVFLKMGDFQVVGIITEKAELGYVVKANNGYFQYVLEEYMERIDPKTAFLSELKGILSKYNACMWVQGGTDANLIISLNGEESVIPNMCGVNADNIDTIKNNIWRVSV